MHPTPPAGDHSGSDHMRYCPCHRLNIHINRFFRCNRCTCRANTQATLSCCTCPTLPPRWHALVPMRVLRHTMITSRATSRTLPSRTHAKLIWSGALRLRCWSGLRSLTIWETLRPIGIHKYAAIACGATLCRHAWPAASQIWFDAQTFL